MRIFFAVVGLLMLPTWGQACDVCGIFLGIQPHDRTSSVSLQYRFRHLEGDLFHAASMAAVPKHGGHGVEGIALTGNDHFRELYQVVELRADIWLSDRIAVLASIPAVNNYRAVNGYVSTDIYGVGDPLVIGRYMVANTKCLTLDEKVVHRLMLGTGAKLPLGRNDVQFLDQPVAVDMQPGSGSLDLLGSLEYMVRYMRNGAALTMIARHNGTNSHQYRLGHGVSTTAEVFRRYDLGDKVELMPSLGLYHELSGRDAETGNSVQGTGSSTLFTHVGSRMWWRNWMLSATFQYAAMRDMGELMVPNKMRIVTGITYNLIKN